MMSNLNVAARFFLITYGLDFVKKGQLQLKLYHQIYWIAWMDTVGKKMQQFSLFRSVVSIFGLTQDVYESTSIKADLVRYTF